MAERIVIGAGATGAAAARRFAANGDRVRVITRSGSGPEAAGIERIALDATRTDELAAAMAGAATVVNASMTAYDTWPETMPPLYDSILAATERVGADYVMLGNLYAYQETSGAVSERTPLEPHTRKGKVRAELWRQALAAHEAGRLRVTEIRAGQYLGRGAVSAFSLLVPAHVAAGELALVLGNPDAAHSFTFTEDAAAALVAAAGSGTAWGRAWNAPVLTVTLRQAADRLAELKGAPRPRLEALTERDLTLLGFSAPIWNEFREMAYMGDRPFVVDDGDFREAFGLKASSLDEALAGM
ncbi:NAD-dependent epimerase/dehydratase family protein [Glycomyces algeriensis]|uniref:NAD-dependent epimerase n=1 Tax=Glycomyces algeriensis TaxID=256037 RepID=A0A9W6GBL3_9ACTN|nr:NAD-dependent epimerase/dehydratase family protein [Glycomyces algeriensis]MDA1365438.1 NAD-dependent epimerase/dehydratase family protein [Glycomyces algeriensis]MDR7351123.1 nucleoside-diphosphate-sugar epimerase [Glycomyces algeriensis]GLI43837.1 NAD-dependent epimerase [Glycomyces algeriensis]